MNDRLAIDPNKIKRKWVACFDLLGFREFVKDHDIVSTFFHWEKCQNTFQINLNNYPKLEYAHFSDTFLIYAPDDTKNSFRQIDTCSRWFFQHVILHQIPLRGALACDEFYADKPNGVFLGKALVMAHEFGEQFNWIGYALSPSALSRMQQAEVNLPSCPVHFRKANVQTRTGSLECIALLCGAGKGRDYIKALEEMKQLSLEDMERKQKTAEQIRKVAEKYDNAIQFIKKFEITV